MLCNKYCLLATQKKLYTLCWKYCAFPTLDKYYIHYIGYIYSRPITIATIKQATIQNIVSLYKRSSNYDKQLHSENNNESEDAIKLVNFQSNRIAWQRESLYFRGQQKI